MSEESTIKHSSFAVALEPEFKEDGTWTGEVTAHVEESLHGDLSDDELTQIRSVCGMMASCLTLMEDDPDFLDYVRDYFISNYEGLIAEFIERVEDDRPDFTKEGNVITLNFNTKTYGNA